MASKKFSKVLTFRINNQEMYTKLERLRIQMNLSKSQVAQEMLRNWIAENDKYDIQENLFNASKSLNK
jgi:hypothetical protein